MARRSTLATDRRNSDAQGSCACATPTDPALRLLDEKRRTEQLVGSTLAQLRGAGVTGDDLLRFVGASLYARRAGLVPGPPPPSHLRSGAHLLFESTTISLATVASLARSPGPHQATACWALEQLRVTVADLGMEHALPPPTDDELILEVRRTTQLISRIVERAWGPLGAPTS